MLDYFTFFKKTTLNERMKIISDKYNLKCHYYKPHVISIKSKQILSYLKMISNSKLTFDEKKLKIKQLDDIMVGICKKMYQKYDPTLIYCFNNEINIVFFYKSNGNYIFDGNVNSILTLLVSEVTLQINKMIINNTNLKDVTFTGKFVEFDKDYEVLNYLIWKQINCKRNTLSLFYKCLYPKKNINNMNLDKMKESLNEMNIENFLTGNILKKMLYYKSVKLDDIDECDDKNIITRKNICINNIYFADNFKENFQKYIKNKIL